MISIMVLLTLVVKVELEKLLEASFIKLIKITDWVSPMVLVKKKKWETTSVHQLLGFKQKHSKGPLPSSIR